MSDPCYLEVRCRKVDQSRFEAIHIDLGWDGPLPNDSHQYIDLYDWESPGGRQDELYKLAEEGIPFYGSHESCEKYPGAFFASADGEIAWISVLDDLPVVHVINESLEWFDQADVEEIEKYYYILKRAKKLLKVED